MSNSDSFIDEVTEEIRRDRLFRLMRRYGWIAVLIVLLIVGGAAWNEWNKAQQRASAEALGDSILAALEQPDPAARAEALNAVDAPDPGAQALIALMAATEKHAEDPAGAAQALLAVADRADVSQIYRQIATFKAATIPGSGLDDQTRRERLEGLALGNGVMRLMADEQIAYLDIAAGDAPAAITRLQQVALDAEATPGLRRRATQVIVALGGEVSPVQDDGQ